MLHCNMTHALDSQLMLEDLLADLQFARRHSMLGRLALLAYCDTKGWARQAGKPDIADKALKMFTETPCLSREEFLAGIDSLIVILERHLVEYQRVQERHLADPSPLQYMMNGHATGKPAH